MALREEETIGALGQRHQRLVMVLEWVRVETLLPYPQRRRGCPHSDRQAQARAFIAKAVCATTAPCVSCAAGATSNVKPTVQPACN